MKLVELLNLCQLSNRSGTIRYVRDGQQGLVHIRDGHALHAEFNNFEGENALYLMLENSSGTAVYDANSEMAPSTIFKPSEQVFAEAARRAEEKALTVRLNLKKTGLPGDRLTGVKFLLLYQAADTEESFLLKLADTSVGKAANNDLVLEHEAVSRCHCRFVIKISGVLELSDLGSLNGTFVNGRRLKKPAQLNHGDLIHIGPVPVRFYIQK
jgi:hypothetical protein